LSLRGKEACDFIVFTDDRAIFWTSAVLVVTNDTVLVGHQQNKRCFREENKMHISKTLSAIFDSCGEYNLWMLNTCDQCSVWFAYLDRTLIPRTQ